jgi:hypothetical protein
MTNRRRPNDGLGLVKGLLKRLALQPGCVDGTHRSPVMFYTKVFALCEHLGRHVLHTGGGRGLARALVRQSGCWILHAFLMLCFTTGVIGRFTGTPEPLGIAGPVSCR